MIIYILCFVLIFVGLFGVLSKRNLIKIVMGLSIMQYGLNLFFILIGYVNNGAAPITTGNSAETVYVDPLPQAMVLTVIVIGLATTSLLLAIAIRIYKKYGTFDSRKINDLKG